jgi:hypothetical protein
MKSTRLRALAVFLIGYLAPLHAQTFDRTRPVAPQLEDNMRGVYSAPARTHPGGSTIRATKLYNIFEHTSGEEWPRVAVTVIKWTPFGTMRVKASSGSMYLPKDECWEYKATLWTSMVQHEDIAPFTVCLDDYKGGTAIEGVSKWAVWFKNPNWDSTDERRTIGPRPPNMPTPRSSALGLDMSVGSRELAHVANLLMQLGFDWGNPQDGRVWIVGFGPSTPQVQSGSMSDLAKQQAEINATWDKLTKSTQAAAAEAQANLKAAQAAQAKAEATAEADYRAHEQGVTGK